ncbi:hypothetical protein BOC52_35780 [Burkholderia pseudomallei]|nr:hypothetical protein BOC60_09990 [Burkholderia pseudomallei]ARL61504.1 hypothetical protein BOC52_35780 [Burkholderia pseudomallei]ARL67938.1 hypothetical protein BOC53_32860 [Burkholderia pseudomallei]
MRPRQRGPIANDNVGYWREIRPLPGEKQFKGRFTPFDLKFEPIESFDPKHSTRAALRTADSPAMKPRAEDIEDTE